jgi:hypothetical protein
MEINGIHIDDLCGYVGASRPELVREAFDLWGDDFHEFKLVGDVAPPPRVMLWEFARKVLGKDTSNYPQEIGDCVSFGAKNAIEHMQMLPILNGVRNVFKPQFPPYLYGTGRVQIGGTRLGVFDGSMGVWQAKAVMQYGTIPTDTPGCPKYSGSIARQWGRGQGPPADFLTVGKEHLVKSAALCKDVSAAIAAVKAGYPVTIASNQGFTMTPQSDGYHHPSGSWGHQMCLVGVDTGEGGGKPCCCILNSWGDVMGKVVDFRDPSIVWPVGTLRVTLEVLDSMIRQGDSFIYSLFDGFPAQPLPRDLFDLWG